MATISSPGLGSGLDIRGLVDQLLAAEGQPATARLDRREARLQAELSALGTFKSAVSEVEAALSALADLSAFQDRRATSTDTGILKVTASRTAANADYSISVEKLAQAHKLASAAFADTTSSATGGNGGTLTFRFGTFSGGTFTVNPERATATVTIDAADSSLEGIRDAVNNADIGVTANIVNDGTGYRLVFVSQYSGAANSLEITVTDGDGNDTDNAGLSQFAYDPAATAGSGRNLTETVAAQDAELIIDGLTVTSATNSVTSAIEGVTLELVKASPGTAVGVSVTRDTGGARSKIETFVEAYNSLAQTIDDLSGYDPETGTGGVLLGDATVRTVESQLRRNLFAAVPNLSGPYQSLADIGIRTGSDGKLALDSSKLQDALSADPDSVGRLFAAAASATDRFIEPSAPGAEAAAGTYAVSITTLAARGYYNGAGVLPADFSTTPLVIDADNDGFTIKVDGIQSGSILLTQGSYTSGAALAAEIQARINGDQALKDAGVSVTVTHDAANNRFVVTSDRYGSASTVEFVSVDTNTAADLGFSVGAGTTGVDVAGTIGGVTATGSGQVLTGSGKAAGISLTVTGGTTGARGTVTVSRGVADTVSTLLENMLESDGLLDSRTDILNERIEDIGDERLKLAERLDRLEQRLLAQFTALDTMLAQLQSTSTFLAQQLASLPGARQTNGSR